MRIDTFENKIIIGWSFNHEYPLYNIVHTDNNFLNNYF